MRTRAISRLPSGPSNKHSSTLVEFCEKSEKLTPLPSQVAPSGYGCPSHTSITFSSVFPVFPSPCGRGRKKLSRVNYVNPRRFELTRAEVRGVLQTVLRGNILHLSCSLQQLANTS